MWLQRIAIEQKFTPTSHCGLADRCGRIQKDVTGAIAKLREGLA